MKTWVEKNQTVSPSVHIYFLFFSCVLFFARSFACFGFFIFLRFSTILIVYPELRTIHRFSVLFSLSGKYHVSCEIYSKRSLVFLLLFFFFRKKKNNNKFYSLVERINSGLFPHFFLSVSLFIEFEFYLLRKINGLYRCQYP